MQQGVALHKKGNLQEAERLYRAILKFQPKHPHANHNLGIIAASLNNSKAALTLFKIALEADPEIEQFWISYIETLIKEQKLTNAQQALSKAAMTGFVGERFNILQIQLTQLILGQAKAQLVTLQGPTQSEVNSLLTNHQNGQLEITLDQALSMSKKFPDHPLSWKVLGAIFGQAGQMDKALFANQKAVLLDPKDPYTHLNLGYTLQIHGRLEQAEASYRKAITIKPDFAEAYYYMGNILKDIKKLEQAETSYRQAIAMKPDYAEAYNNLGATLQNLGRLKQAEAIYRQAMAIKPDYAEAHYNLGNMLKDLNRLLEAETSYRQAIELKPDYAEAFNNLGNTLAQLRKLKDAEISYRQAIELKPDYAEAYNNLGALLNNLGELEQSEASYRQAIEVNPDYAEAYNNLGATLQNLGRMGEAEVNYKQAVVIKTDFSEAHNNLGNIEKFFGRLKQAEASFRQAIELNPDYAEAYSNLSMMLKDQGDLADALVYCKKSILLDQDAPDAHLNMGILLYANGDIDPALESIRKAISIDPKSQKFKLSLAAVQARKAKEKHQGMVSNISSNLGLTSNPLILKRAVEPELITSLYEMSFRELDNTKGNDARYGNGRCSPDFSMFTDNRPIIKNLADNLTTIMMQAVNSNIYIYDSFFNILGAGGGVIPHNHITGFDNDNGLCLGNQKYSLVYYLSVGDQDCNSPGILKLYDPNRDVLPYDGMIAIIPAGRKHSAVYSGKKDRVMIGVNFYSL